MGLRAEKRPARGESPRKDSGRRVCTLAEVDVPANLPSRLRAARRDRPAAAAFAGVFLATLLGFFAVGAVLPILPRYVHGPIGAGDLAVGVVVGAFAFTAVVGRPIGGRMADATGRRMVVVAG